MLSSVILKKDAHSILTFPYETRKSTLDAKFNQSSSSVHLWESDNFFYGFIVCSLSKDIDIDMQEYPGPYKLVDCHTCTTIRHFDVLQTTTHGPYSVASKTENCFCILSMHCIWPLYPKSSLDHSYNIYSSYLRQCREKLSCTYLRQCREK